MEKTIFLIILTCLALLPAGCLGHEPKGRLETGNNLSPCPDSPNCVSTQSDENAMTPLPYLGTKKKSHEDLIRILQSMKGCTITKDEPGHVQAEFRSALFGFVDDVTFIFDDDAASHPFSIGFQNRLLRFWRQPKTDGGNIQNVPQRPLGLGFYERLS